MTVDSEASLVSIITPAYNAASHIRDTIESVRRQSYEDWEMLIVDDGSTDETVVIVEKAVSEDSRVKLIRPDGETGLAARARNRAMSRARGEFFALLDADDLWFPEKLERQVAYLRDHTEADGVCSWFELFGDEEAVKLQRRMMNRNMATVIGRREIIEEGLPMLTSTVVFRRSCYDHMGGMDEDPALRTGQDMEYYARLIATFQFHRIREPLTRYRVAAPKQALSTRYNKAEDPKGWKIFSVLERKGVFTPAEIRTKRSILYCAQAHQNLFYFNAPYRRFLVLSILTGKPSLKALVMLSLSFLPAPLLRPILLRMRGILLWCKARPFWRHGAS